MARKILIVSRTQMKNGVCVGGVDVNTCELIRLHNDRGGNLTIYTPYQIGEVWEMNVEFPWNPRVKPHVEDRMTTPLSLIGRIDVQGISSFLNGNIVNVEIAPNRSNDTMLYLIDGENIKSKIVKGTLDVTFEGKLKFAGRASYIGKEDVSNFSTQFWITDKPLYHRVSFEKHYYVYNNTYIRFVGFQDMVEVIPAGTIIRLSLANWWDGDGSGEERCYLQLSGWYL